MALGPQRVVDRSGVMPSVGLAIGQLRFFISTHLGLAPFYGSATWVTWPKDSAPTNPRNWATFPDWFSFQSPNRTKIATI
jgi:hypothetical protein